MAKQVSMKGWLDSNNSICTQGAREAGIAISIQSRICNINIAETKVFEMADNAGLLIWDPWAWGNVPHCQRVGAKWARLKITPLIRPRFW